MIRTFLIAGLAACTAIPLCAQEARPADEAKPADTRFSSADANGDGILTLDEMKTHRREQAAALRKTGDGDDPAKSLEELQTKYGGMMTLEDYLRYDKDDDGRLTQAEFDELKNSDPPDFTAKDAEIYGDIAYGEWSTFANARGDEFKITDYAERMTAARRVQRIRAGNDLKKRYAMGRANSNLRDYHDILLADADGDGTVSRAESREYWQKNHSGTFDGKLSDASGKLYNEARFAEWTSVLDSNDDGILTRDEVNNAWDAPDDDAWKRLDANGDGQLDRDEIGAWETPNERARSSSQPRREGETPKREGETPKREGETPDTPKTPNK